ncbi:uncharacterized protein LOC120214237 [Hibiscus syriacus]|uniref:uncharacterized protein LOC120214237 n=1 Tax=Hibiscus syriacus TaxID=106335 RepID=UPI001924D9A8|nr:uncharacterized protein LOC120214237 [Hibiscus syriacus]
MKEFQDALLDLEFLDHLFYGLTFTWSNKQQESYLAKNLDRVLVNPLWFTAFPKSHVEFLAPGISNHCLAIAWLSKEVHTDHPKPFKFLYFWANHSEFLNIVSQSWQSSSQGNPMQQLFFKLKRLKNSLKALNQNQYSNISARVNQKKMELQEQQIRSLNFADSFHKELQLQNELHLLEEAENMFLRQKAKVQWINHGDKCTKFFHSVVATRSKRDTIHKAWPIIGDDVVAVISHFFRNPYRQPIAFNATCITLVPKIPNPSKVTDFRPISCCSVVYKTVSKILVKLLTPLLPEIISFNQSAFVKGRNLVDNILLVQELVKGYGRKTLSPGCSLKIDLNKAFDSLYWDFISDTLIAIALPTTYIKWVEACFTTAHYSISFNGSLIGFFKGARGLRYLGIPLVSRKLSEKDCVALIENIRATNPPQSVLNRIEQLCSRFFWKGSDIAATGARIRWDKLCLPKSEGGLGLKDIKSWNKSCILHLIKKILAGDGSLWIAWIKTYVIKNSDFWTMEARINTSWSFRKLLSMRN